MRDDLVIFDEAVPERGHMARSPEVVEFDRGLASRLRWGSPRCNGNSDGFASESPVNSMAAHASSTSLFSLAGAASTFAPLLFFGLPPSLIVTAALRPALGPIVALLVTFVYDRVKL